jgi:hypothetical protein
VIPKSHFEVENELRGLFFEGGEHDFLKSEGVLCGHTPDDPLLRANNYYKWYYAIGRYYKPINIVEIGTYYGYSLWSMIKGSESESKSEGRVKMVDSYDNCSYDENSEKVCERVFSSRGYDYTFHRVDTQKIERLDIEYTPNIVHVDGDHSYKGALHDMGLAIETGSEMILVDDVDAFPTVRKAVVKIFGETGIYLPTYRGLFLRNL